MNWGAKSTLTLPSAKGTFSAERKFMGSLRNKNMPEAIIEVCQRLHARNMLASADGNVSMKDKEGRVWITPSGVMKASMTSDEMAVMTLEGEVLQGTPSGERWMHLQVYKQAPQAAAVVHAHPPYAIAWSLAFPDSEKLPEDVLPEVLLATGEVPIVPYARPTTESMADNLKPFLPEKRVMILARHGALSWGASLDEAYRGMERVEHSAQIIYLAKSMGQLRPLPEEELRELRRMRDTIGEKTL